MFEQAFIMLFGIPYIEWLGYTASFIIAVSLLMSSIIKLRWLNFVGAVMISAYGYLLGSMPVFGLNLAIAIIDAFYLYKIYAEKEYFKVLEIKENDSYLAYFMKYFKNDIRFYFPDFNFNCCEHADTVSFYILSNTRTAGIFIGQKFPDGALLVHMDYTIPEYRDFKIGNYIYIENERYFAHLGYKKFITMTSSPKHEKYLKKMGFSFYEKNNSQSIYTKPIRSNDIFID